MITFEEALDKILDSIQPMPVTKVALRKLPGHVLAEPVVARLDLPPFDNSAVDGFGVRLSDIESASESHGCKLKLAGTIRAGDPPINQLASGTAMKILTGACVPSAVEAVVMREYCVEEDGHVIVKAGASSGENIRRRGGEFLRGQEVLADGAYASPAVIGLLANLGYSSFAAYKKPASAVITTGDELTKPGRELLPGKIYDSNSYAMRTALELAGSSECFSLHAGEDHASTRRAFIKALNLADLVISTGGVSVGDYDFVKPVLEEIGVTTELWRIAIKPGKPVYFGVYYDRRRGRNKYIFGLPGNPVSALVTYHQLVKPALAKLAGLARCKGSIVTAVLTQDIRKRAGRAEFVRGILKPVSAGMWEVEPTVGQDSHMLSGIAKANALIHFPLESELLKNGSQVKVEPIRWELA